MVWFQCEDCGENLKKPKLPNHFRICSAFKLSCIDCGETFSQQSVQGHNQCISEAEKYGPKGQGQAPNSTPGKQNKDSKEQIDFDIKVGLSNRPPWFCSLCNTKATSEQTLLLHAEGKKHKAKARAVHRSKQQPQQAEQSTTPQAAASSEKASLGNATNSEEQKPQHSPETGVVTGKSEAGTGNVSENKKRKRDGSENDDMKKQKGNEAAEVGNGEAYQGDKEAQTEVRKINWKKLINSTLKANPEGAMKMKKLRKVVAKSIKESGAVVDESTLADTLQQKINGSCKFTVDGKYVRLVKKN